MQNAIFNLAAIGSSRSALADHAGTASDREIVRTAGICAWSGQMGIRTFPTGTARALVLLAAVISPLVVWAQEVPLGFHLGPGETVQHDSNITQMSEASGYPILSDTSYITNLTGTFHETYGRQDLSVSAMIARVNYEHVSQYDVTEQNFRLALQSTLPYNVDSTVRLTRTAYLAHFADFGVPVRDVISTNDAYAMIDFPLSANWRSVLGGEAIRTQNSSGLLVTQNLNTNEFDAGIRFQPISRNHVDLLVRTVEGSYPNGTPSSLIGPGYNDHGVDLRVDWTFTGASHLLGRAGYIERRNDTFYYLNTSVVPPQNELINRNFSGPAFDLTYIWQITGASKLTLYGLRATGASGDNNYESAVTHTFRITPAYLPTEKVEIDAYYEWTQADYFTNVYAIVTNQPAGVARLDDWHNAGISVLWSPRRWLQVKFDAHRLDRDSNIAYWTFAENVASVTLQTSF
ncbi:MAG TPA: hypothetical protein VED47_11730 [Burkholderiaceae bacterium]|nr:hypothetical protein [Burkholderiaceae bacterium]